METAKNEAAIPGVSRFFKTGKGQYGEGDIFWGIKVPAQQQIAKRHLKTLQVQDFGLLLAHPVHEIRLSTLYIMVKLYEKADADLKNEIYALYMQNLNYINNWDLVDCSAPGIVGAHLIDGQWDILYEMAVADHLWTQRVAIIATYYHIRKGIYEPTLRISELLLNHSHDLIHKAVGWMLREIGNRDMQTEQSFLQKHYMQMPRTMLRYAIEKFEESLRQDYLKGRI